VSRHRSPSMNSGSHARDFDPAIDSTRIDTESLGATEDFAVLARSGARWGIIAQVTQQGLSVLATVVLARLLTPTDFGIVTATVTLLQFGQLALSMGWGVAILRKPVLDSAYLSSVFWLVTGVATALTVAVAICAQFLTALIGVSAVAPYLAVLAVSCIPVAAQIVPTSLLQRRLQLRAMHLAGIISVFAYIVVQVVLAVLGAGAWAVIIGIVTQSFVQFAGVSIASRWRPRLMFCRALIREDLRLAGGLVVFNALNYGVRNADYWVVGRVLGPAALGAYYVAYVLPQILRLRVTWVVGAVLFPVLAHLRSDLERTQQVYAHSVLLGAWIGFPAMGGLAVLAEPVTVTFFGPQWDAAVEPLRWLAFVALIEFVTFAPGVVAQVHGAVHRLLVTNVIRLILLLLAVVVAGNSFRSVGAVAAGVFCATAVFAVYQQLALARPLGLRISPILKDLSAIALLSTLMGVVVAALVLQTEGWSPILQIVVCTITGAAVYFSVGWLLLRSVTGPLMRSVFASVRLGSDAPPVAHSRNELAG
jgi:O-antigen/teichoic acid export membrane protein